MLYFVHIYLEYVHFYSSMYRSIYLVQEYLNPSNAEASLLQRTRTQLSLKLILNPVMLVFIG